MATSTANTFITKVVEQIVNPLILLLSAVALVVFAWGLYKLVASAGEDKGREEGRRAILWGIIGFVQQSLGISGTVTSTPAPSVGNLIPRS